MVLETIDSPAELKALPAEQLPILAEELRAAIVAAVARVGGHLGSNLGVVELGIALHRTFDSPRDLIVWDTGHQAYVHKMLTGRRALFDTLRQAGGLSGYPCRAESAHDRRRELPRLHGPVVGLRPGPRPGRRPARGSPPCGGGRR